MSCWRAISRVIPLTIPSHQAKGGNADPNGSIAAFPDRRPSDAPINNRDVSSHSSTPCVARSTFWDDTAASCRVTRPSRPWRCGPRTLSLSCTDSVHRVLVARHCFMPSYVVIPCQLNYRRTPCTRLSLCRNYAPRDLQLTRPLRRPWSLESFVVQHARDRFYIIWYIGRYLKGWTRDLSVRFSRRRYS